MKYCLFLFHFCWVPLSGGPSRQGTSIVGNITIHEWQKSYLVSREWLCRVVRMIFLKVVLCSQIMLSRHYVISRQASRIPDASRNAFTVRFRGSNSFRGSLSRFRRGSLSRFRHNVSHKCIRKHLLSYSLIYILSRNQKLYAMSPTMDTHALHTAQRDDFSQLGNAMSLKVQAWQRSRSPSSDTGAPSSHRSS